MDAPALFRGFAPRADELAGRVIAVTGASSGLGRALALAAAAQGGEVLLLGKSIKPLEAVHAAIEGAGGRASIAPLDLERALARDYDALAGAIDSTYGRLDGLVHCAAQLGALAPIEHYDVPRWCSVLHVNLTAAFALTQVLLPLLRRAPVASLVFTSCAVAKSPRAYWGAYAVSKAALENFAGVLADELEAEDRVRVNTLDPGAMATRLRRAAFPSEDLAGLADPAACMRPYLWLLSAASRGIKGQHLLAEQLLAPAD
jgi:NAD(P)-dependent dehydrogenase (short-subunit alcohol dehydrogenase family)